jgi:hypothetical protein
MQNLREPQRLRADRASWGTGKTTSQASETDFDDSLTGVAAAAYTRNTRSIGKPAVSRLKSFGSPVAITAEPKLSAVATTNASTACEESRLLLNRELIEQALRETGAKSKAEVIEMGLRLLLERAARQRLKAVAGRLRPLREVSRRRV